MKNQFEHEMLTYKNEEYQIEIVWILMFGIYQSIISLAMPLATFILHEINMFIHHHLSLSSSQNLAFWENYVRSKLWVAPLYIP